MTPTVRSEAVRERTLTAVRARSVPSRAAGTRGRRLALAAGALYLVGAFLSLGGVVLGSRPTAYVVGFGFSWGIVAAAVTWTGMVRGRSMLGHSIVLQGWMALAVTPALAIVALGVGAAWAHAGVDSVGVRAHASCFALTVLLAVGPFAATALVRRGSEPVAPRRVGAVLGAVAGTWAGLAMQLHCSHASIPHVLFGHVLPVLVMTGIGFALGAAVFGLRRR